MKMYLAGEWVDRDEKIDVVNPFNGQVFDTVPRGSVEDVQTAIASADRGAKAMAAMSGYQRYEILTRAVGLMRERVDDLGRTITMEEGKIIGEGLGEAERAIQTMTGSAEEAKRLSGEVVPLDGAPTWTGQLGFTLRVPCGVVAAISPFNFPLNLVAHKVGPALAAGNAVIIKPASDTPLSALKLTEILVEAGLPAEAVQCVTGPGGTIGDALVADDRVRKVTFTGSRDVGEHICRTAGLKKVTMELGSNSPLIVMPDADMEKVVAGTVASGFSNAGQVCISAQRILTNERVYADYLDALTEGVKGLSTGDPLDGTVKMGPMVRPQDAVRVNEWVTEAVAGGARTVVGGRVRGVDARAHSSGRREPGDAHLVRRAVRPGRSRDAVLGHRPGHRDGQRHQLRVERGDLHSEYRLGDEVRPRGGLRQPHDQLGAAVESRPDALRRGQGQRHGQRGPQVRGAGDDRAQDGHLPPVGSFGGLGQGLSIVVTELPSSFRPPSRNPSPQPCH